MKAVGRANFLWHKGLTLVELLVVMAVLASITGGAIAFLRASNRTFSSGRDQLAESRQARMAITEMDNLLRQADPDWDAAHGVTVSDANSRIDFYIPSFYADCCPACAEPALCTDVDGVLHTRGEISGLRKVTFKLNPDNAAQLLEKVGTEPSRVIANNVTGVQFGCGCTGCIAINDACPVVDISITTQVQRQYQLNVKTALRNQNVTITEGTVIEEPAEGEF